MTVAHSHAVKRAAKLIIVVAEDELRTLGHPRSLPRSCCATQNGFGCRFTPQLTTHRDSSSTMKKTNSWRNNRSITGTKSTTQSLACVFRNVDHIWLGARDAGVLTNVALDCPLGDPDAELEQLASDALRAPEIP